jgi:hypothetical protein
MCFNWNTHHFYKAELCALASLTAVDIYKCACEDRNEITIYSSSDIVSLEITAAVTCFSDRCLAKEFPLAMLFRLRSLESISPSLKLVHLQRDASVTYMIDLPMGSSSRKERPVSKYAEVWERRQSTSPDWSQHPGKRCKGPEARYCTELQSRGSERLASPLESWDRRMPSWVSVPRTNRAFAGETRRKLPKRQSVGSVYMNQEIRIKHVEISNLHM